MIRETVYFAHTSSLEPRDWSKPAAVRGNQSGFEV